MKMATTLRYKGRECKVLGTVGASRSCDCCGNTILEKAIAIEVEGVDVYEIGCVCAAKNIFGDGRSSRKVKSLAEAADALAKREAQYEMEMIADRMIHRSEMESHGITNSNYKNLALLVYIRRGRNNQARRLWTNGEWAVAVDISDAKDIARWSKLGFTGMMN